MTERLKLNRWVALVSTVAIVLALTLTARMKSELFEDGSSYALAASEFSEPAPTLQPAVEGSSALPGSAGTSSSTATALTRTISVNPASFVRDDGSTTILMDNNIALRWAAGSTEQAGFYMKRPADWNDTTPLKIHLYFALGGSTAGAVNWRLKFNSYTPGSGEYLTNPATRNADAIVNFPSGSWYRIYSQTFTLQPGNEPLWSFFFLRGSGSNSETFTGHLYVLDVEVEYEFVSPISALYLPYIEH